MRKLLFLIAITIALYSCSSQQQVTKLARQAVLDVRGLKNAHVGISIYNSDDKKIVYDYNGSKYFVPASNTKIPTAYVAMKYLGDSLPGIKVSEFDDRLVLRPTGDPTLLDPEFNSQPVFEFLRKTTKRLYAVGDSINTSAWGSGWSWGDYDADYMPERSSLPIYSNVVWFYGRKNGMLNYFPAGELAKVRITTSTIGTGNYLQNVTRDLRVNDFKLNLGASTLKEIRVPFITSVDMQWQLLADTLHKNIQFTNDVANKHATIFSQPTDSVLKLMMHRSDNFFAEQFLLMASNALLGEMTNSRFIDSVLNSEFRDLPQKPRWVDGSGLSRYNLFTPQDFVAILQKMKAGFGMERIKSIFATGGRGTISSYYKEEAGKIYAKTGTLSGVVALSGFLYSKKNKLLVFSVLVNNHNTSAAEVRRAVEKFLKQIRQKY